MLLSDLLRIPVRSEGRLIGYVIDARFLRRGTSAGQSASSAELVGLIVGPRRTVSFLGYERNQVTAPALVAHALRRRQAGCFLLDLADVDSMDDTGIHLRHDFTRWSAMEDAG